jgi:hypothetical protein
MSEPIKITYLQRPPLPKVPTYVAYCCREWIAPYGFRGTTCGLCGERPTYLRPDPESPAFDEEPA